MCYELINNLFLLILGWLLWAWSTRIHTHTLHKRFRLFRHFVVRDRNVEIMIRNKCVTTSYSVDLVNEYLFVFICRVSRDDLLNEIYWFVLWVSMCRFFFFRNSWTYTITCAIITIIIIYYRQSDKRITSLNSMSSFLSNCDVY